MLMSGFRNIFVYYFLEKKIYEELLVENTENSELLKIKLCFVL